MGMTTNETLWQVFRGLSGMASAGAIILGAALVMKSVAPIHTGLATGVYLSGTGAGIVLAGLLAEWFKPILSWQQLWMAAGGISLLLCLPALLSDVFPRAAPPRASTAQGLRGRGLSLLVTLIFLAYFCAGLGYVVSATFLVAVLKAVEHLRAYGDLAWVLVGLAAAPSSIVWAALARRLGHFTALILAFVCQGVGVMMPVLSDSLLAAFLGAGLFGGTFLGIVSMVLNYSGRLSSEHPTRLVGLMTVAFGLGQILGPWGAGWLAEAQGNYNSSLLAASAVSFLGAVFIALSALSVRMMPLHAQPKMHTE
jgi:predicted MFS family arabinose efflux permease